MAPNQAGCSDGFSAVAEEHEAIVLDPSEITRCLPLQTIFGTAEPLEVDVGCGKGRFLLERARRHPATPFLGIERLKGRVESVRGKIQRAGMSNVRLLRLEALYTLQFLLPPNSVRAVYVFFPDPWPKRKHHRRRLFSPEFLATLNEKLIPGGALHVATDHLDYFAAIAKLLRADERFEEVEAYQRDEAEQTDFERIFRGKGMEIGEASFVTKPGYSSPPQA